MITITKQHYSEILNHAVKDFPNEACGLLGGTIDGEIKNVKRIYCLTNIDKSPEHFTMDPKEQFQAIKDIRNNGWHLLGNFHSHPASPSRPSDEDKRLAYDSHLSYFIISLLERQNPVLKSFKILKNNSDEERINIIKVDNG